MLGEIMRVKFPLPGADGLAIWTQLTLLMVATLVPLLLFATGTLWWIATQSREAAERSLVDTTRALAVDAELRAWKVAHQTLAASTALQRGDFEQFYEEAQAVAAQHDGWVVLFDRETRQIINTLRPFGAELPKSGSGSSIDSSAPRSARATLTSASTPSTVLGTASSTSYSAHGFCSS